MKSTKPNTQHETEVTTSGSKQELNPHVATSIQKALDANRKLQSGLLSRLHTISRLKKINRRNCAELLSASDRYHSTRRKRRSRFEEGNTESSPVVVEASSPTSSSSRRRGVKRQRPTSEIVQKWAYDQNRRWTRRFFVDPDKTVPEPNPDTIRRREWEGDMASMDQARFQPWSKIELNILKECAENVRSEQTKNEQNPVKDADIDFQRVAHLVQQQISQRNASRKREKLIHFRALCDYRLKFLNDLSSSIHKGPFTKKEQLTILEQLHQHHGHPRWDDVARSLGTNRTPFQCFVYAQSKLLTSSVSFSSSTLSVANPTPINYHDDKLLLKFVAASGPQTVVNNHVAAFLCQRFFPHLTKAQILCRYHTSLLNPNFDHRKWSEREERLLVLGMRFFSESDSAIVKVSALFPHRIPRSVHYKWCNSLDPNYSTQPFTARDDKALLAAVKSSNRGTINWNDISKMFGRHPGRVFNRWLDIATKQDICEMKRDSFIKSMIGWGLFGDSDVNDEYFLNTDDFVVCTK